MTGQRGRIEDGDDFQDTGLLLSVFRPQTGPEWAAWHTTRDMARDGITRHAHDEPDERLLLAALGLDAAGERALLDRLAG